MGAAIVQGLDQAVSLHGGNDLPDGVYVRLPDAAYFAQPRLGSTDLTVLHKRPADWWYGSRWNPDHVREASEEMQFGSALHAIVLEGEAAYGARVAVKPEFYPVEDAKGFPTGEKKPWHGAARYCQRWTEANHDRLQLTAVQDRAVRHMAALILNHPQLGPVMRAGMPEVAVLWTNAQGVKLRAKLDYLLPRFSIDLKSFGGDAKGLDLTQQVLSLVAQRDMDVQRYLYFTARIAMASLLADGQVFGATLDETAWLTKVAGVEDWQWCWIFYRRRDDGRGYAPVIKPILRSHFDKTFETGRLKCAVALANYAAFDAVFGPRVPWAVVEESEEPDDHQFPAWMQNVAKPHQFPLAA